MNYLFFMSVAYIMMNSYKIKLVERLVKIMSNGYKLKNASKDCHFLNVIDLKKRCIQLTVLTYLSSNMHKLVIFKKNIRLL